MRSLETAGLRWVSNPDKEKLETEHVKKSATGSDVQTDPAAQSKISGVVRNQAMAIRRFMTMVAAMSMSKVRAATPHSDTVGMCSLFVFSTSTP